MEPLRIGMLVPSSNTVAEPLMAAMLRDMPEVSLHVARFRVTRLDTGAEALAQFTPEPLLEAASLLADAKVHAIALNATAACYTGMRHDRAFVAAVETRFGIPATTAMLAFLGLLSATGLRRIGLVTPFLHDVQAATIRVLGEEGLEVVAERHLNDPGNYSFADHSEETVTGLLREVAAAGPDALAVVSTNLRGGPPCVAAEAETGLPALDTGAAVLWGAIRAAGADASRLRGWGRLYA